MTLGKLESTGDLQGLAISMTYGKYLPQGKEWGSRVARRHWLESERAKRTRRMAAQAAVRLLETKADLMHFYRQVRKLRGYGPLLKFVIREWNEAHGYGEMEA